MTFRPIALTSELIAFSDDGSETVVMNWRENTFALLKGSQQPIDERFQYVSVSCIIHEDQSLIVVTIQQLSSGCLRLQERPRRPRSLARVAPRTQTSTSGYGTCHVAMRRPTLIRLDRRGLRQLAERVSNRCRCRDMLPQTRTAVRPPR